MTNCILLCPVSWLTISNTISASGSREFHAYIKHISKVSREYLLTVCTSCLQGIPGLHSYCTCSVKKAKILQTQISVVSRSSQEFRCYWCYDHCNIRVHNRCTSDMHRKLTGIYCQFDTYQIISRWLLYKALYDLNITVIRCVLAPRKIPEVNWQNSDYSFHPPHCSPVKKRNTNN